MPQFSVDQIKQNLCGLDFNIRFFFFLSSLGGSNEWPGSRTFELQGDQNHQKNDLGPGATTFPKQRERPIVVDDFHRRAGGRYRDNVRVHIFFKKIF